MHFEDTIAFSDRVYLYHERLRGEEAEPSAIMIAATAVKAGAIVDQSRLTRLSELNAQLLAALQRFADCATDAGWSDAVAHLPELEPVMNETRAAIAKATQ